MWFTFFVVSCFAVALGRMVCIFAFWHKTFLKAIFGAALLMLGVAGIGNSTKQEFNGKTVRPTHYLVNKQEGFAVFVIEGGENFTSKEYLHVNNASNVAVNVLTTTVGGFFKHKIVEKHLVIKEQKYDSQN